MRLLRGRYSPTLPAHDELAMRDLQAKQIDVFCSAAALGALTPRRCSPEGLASMRIGAVEVAQVAEERDASVCEPR